MMRIKGRKNMMVREDEEEAENECMKRNVRMAMKSIKWKKKKLRMTN